MSLLGNIVGFGTQLLAARNATQSSVATQLRTMPNVVRQSNAAGRAFGLAPLPTPGGFRTGGTMSSSYTSSGQRKRRRTNPTNVRALRRALSRVEGFIKIEKRVDKILRKVAPKARSAARVGFIKRKR